jgi:hypothetical protein
MDGCRSFMSPVDSNVDDAVAFNRCSNSSRATELRRRKDINIYWLMMYSKLSINLEGLAPDFRLRCQVR